MSLLSPPDISFGVAQQRHKREGRGVIFARRAIFLEIVLWIRGMRLSVGSVWPFFSKLIYKYINSIIYSNTLLKLMPSKNLIFMRKRSMNMVIFVLIFTYYLIIDKTLVAENSKQECMFNYILSSYFILSPWE